MIRPGATRGPPGSRHVPSSSDGPSPQANGRPCRLGRHAPRLPLAAGGRRRGALSSMAFRLARDARLVRFSSADGVSLEGRLTGEGRDRGVVLCHPHPLYGGSMLTPVILTVEAAFR